MSPPSNINGPWQKRVLIPFWTIQLIVLVALTVIDSLVVAYYGRDDGAPLPVGIPIVLALYGLFIALEIIEIVLFARRMLKPLFFLISNIMKTGFFLAVFIEDAVVTAYGNSEIQLIIVAAILLCFLGTLIYGAVIYHRARKAGNRGVYTATPATYDLENADATSLYSASFSPPHQHSTNTAYRGVQSGHQPANVSYEGAQTTEFYTPRPAHNPHTSYYTPADGAVPKMQQSQAAASRYYAPPGPHPSQKHPALQTQLDEMEGLGR
ncbi:hypothetical protein B0A49_05035 [Cryomyces minteri]|uniref:Uncharacterized protein n=1 Tax=Cryomyces minteri TaxID=331657 RepID=A0A4U0XF06_9PEZI|nr:hypothetical protein B0A49_05035 [Cryomyces minteri]